MTRFALLAGFPVVVTLAAFLYVQLPDVGASAVLHPSRRLVTTAVPTACVERTFQGAGVDLTGWQCHAPEPARGTVVYLHGVADNRASGVGTIARFLRRGFEVVTYDSRAHGGSGGEACTYGFFEKDDLKLVIDTVRRLPVVLIGTSLGAAVALQHAARSSTRHSRARSRRRRSRR